MAKQKKTITPLRILSLKPQISQGCPLVVLPLSSKYQRTFVLHFKSTSGMGLVGKWCVMESERFLSKQVISLNIIRI